MRFERIFCARAPAAQKNAVFLIRIAALFDLPRAAQFDFQEEWQSGLLQRS